MNPLLSLKFWIRSFSGYSQIFVANIQLVIYNITVTISHSQKFASQIYYARDLNLKSYDSRYENNCHNIWINLVTKCVKSTTPFVPFVTKWNWTIFLFESEKWIFFDVSYQVVSYFWNRTWKKIFSRIINDSIFRIIWSSNF